MKWAFGSAVMLLGILWAAIAFGPRWLESGLTASDIGQGAPIAETAPRAAADRGDGRAAAIDVGQVDAGGGERASRAKDGVRRCGAARLRLVQLWRPPGPARYVDDFPAVTLDIDAGPNRTWKQLGEHRTRPILEGSSEVATWCDGKQCRTCITEINAEIGFAPSEIWLHRMLRREHCARAFHHAA